AVATLKAAGGVLGKKLAREIGDDACDPKQARSVAEKFASAKIPFVAGHYCSSSSIPASEAYADGNVLQITPASTNPLYTERKLWNVARVCGRDDQQGSVAGQFIAKNYKGKNIAILNDKTTYGKGLADETKKALSSPSVPTRATSRPPRRSSRSSRPRTEIPRATPSIPTPRCRSGHRR